MHKVKSLLGAKELKSLAFLIILFLSVGFMNPSFLSFDNLMMTFNGSVIYMVTAIGIAFVIFTGEIDVSVGATIGLSAAISATLIRDGAPIWIAILAALLVGAVVGTINGLGVVKFGIPSIIMTLGINGIVRGLIYVFTEGKWVENIPLEFKSLSQASLGGTVSYFLLGTIAVMVVLHFILKKTRRGKYIAAVGDNIGGATLLGIPVNKTKILSFILCGVFASIAGVMYVSRVGFVTPMAGNGYEMKAIAACVLGGISLTGGVGSLIGAAIGATIMSSISRVLVFMGVSSDYDNMITGMLLIIIVVVDALIVRHAAEKARRRRLAARTAHWQEKGEEEHE